MLNQIETMFDGMLDMMKKLKKASYEKNMKGFRERNGHFFREMMEYMEEHEDKEAAAKKIGDVLVEAVRQSFSIKGKMRSRTQADLNFFMIYYVFPAVLLEESKWAEMTAQGIRDAWRAGFPGSNIQYATYEKLYGAFREKIFGIF